MWITQKQVQDVHASALKNKGAHCAPVYCAPVSGQKVHALPVCLRKRCTACTLTRQTNLLTIPTRSTFEPPPL